jgi:tRNA threonylcarbamoyladenosine biosynthesis protein TsaE
MAINIKTANAMQKLGSIIAKFCVYGSVIYLHGDLGAGKTTLVRGFLRQMGYHGHVRSPTFTLVEPYDFGVNSIYHFDLYRLGDARELFYMGCRDYFTEQNICLVEWPEKGIGGLPAADLICNFRFNDSGKGRIVELNINADSGKYKDIKKMLENINYVEI